MFSQKDVKIEKAREEEEAFFSDVSGFSFARKEEREIVIELWEDNIPIYEIFSITRYYTDGWGKVDSLIIIEMAKEKGISISLALDYFMYIYGSYQKTITPKKEVEKGEE